MERMYLVHHEYMGFTATDSRIYHFLKAVNEELKDGWSVKMISPMSGNFKMPNLAPGEPYYYFCALVVLEKKED